MPKRKRVCFPRQYSLLCRPPAACALEGEQRRRSPLTELEGQSGYPIIPASPVQLKFTGRVAAAGQRLQPPDVELPVEWLQRQRWESLLRCEGLPVEEGVFSTSPH